MKTNRVITKILMIIVIIAALSSMLALSVFAADGDACETADCSGTYSNGICSQNDSHYQAPVLSGDGYYEIANAGHLRWFSQEVNNGSTTINARLTADISLENKHFEPIASNDDNIIDRHQVYYSGIFDGQGHRVNGVNIEMSGAVGVGFFGLTKNATIKNLGIAGWGPTGSASVGGIVGYATDSTITDCYNLCNVEASNNDAGGIVGKFPGTTITRCYNLGAVACYNGQVGYAGGIAGGIATGGVITDCYNGGDVYASGRYASGIAYSADEIKYCYNKGNVTALYNNAYMITSGFVLTTNCYGTDVSADDYKSGKIAYLLQAGRSESIWGQRIGTDDYPILSQDRVYLTELCQVEYTNTKGAVKQHEWGTVSYCLGRKCNDCSEYSGEVASTYKHVAGCGFKNGIGSTCGRLESASKTKEGFTIKNAGQLLWFAKWVNDDNTATNGKLTDNIDLTGIEYTPIGTEANPYVGTFDGQGYSIKNMTVNSTAGYQGLFGYVGAGAAIQNIIIDASCSISGGDFTAAIVGGSVRGTSGTVTIEGCINYADVSGGKHAGGIFGGNTGADATVIIRYCANLGNVTGTSLSGAITGYLGGAEAYGTIECCWNTGILTCPDGGDSFAHADIGRIQNCYNLDTLAESGRAGVVNFTAEALASGELAYVLYRGWGQTIGEDTIPVPGGAKVYYGYISCAEDAQRIYTNDASASAEKPHKDENTDHICDNECGKVDMGEHSDSATDTDHVCDYGCGVTIEDCLDAENDNDHSCDVCAAENVSAHTYGDATCEAPATCSECGATTGDALGHRDENTDHICDNECGKVDAGEHSDLATDTDHMCDYGCGETLEACSGGKATCQAKAICSVCNTEYGELAPHSAETTWRTDEAHHYHICIYWTEGGTCQERFGYAEHADENSDGMCDICEYQMSTSGEQTETTTPTDPVEPADPQTPAPDPAVPDPSENNDGPGTGAIVGIVLGSAAVVGGGGFSIFWFVIRKKKRI